MMKFRSAVDGWFVVLGLVLPALTLVLVTLFVERWDQGTAFIFAGAALLAVGLPIWLMLTTDYTLDDSVLSVRSGPFRWRIPLTEIHSVTPSHSLQSSPALSLKRLEIRYGDGKRLLISPADTRGFMRAFEATHSNFTA